MRQLTRHNLCSTINRGETEDYLIDIQAARIAPLTDFTSNTTFTCDGIVKFEDTTPNQVTSRLWDFGDGGHFYSIQPNTQTIPLLEFIP